MLASRAHEGLQPPSNLEERKGHKEAQDAAHVHSAAHPSPLEPAGRSPPRSRAPRQDSRPCPASPPRSRVASLPSRERIDSASLEATPRQEDKRPFRSPARRTEALNANHSSTAPGSDGVRPPRRTAAVTRIPSANSGHCSTIPGTVAPLWEPAAPCTRHARHCFLHCATNSVYLPHCGILDRHGRDPRTRPGP